MIKRRVTRAAFLPTASTIALAAFCISTANAQDAANAPATQVESVTVTGSRLSSSFAAPTPVTAINTDQLAQVTSNNISEALVQLPSLVGSLNTTNAGSGSPSAGTNGDLTLNGPVSAPVTGIVSLTAGGADGLLTNQAAISGGSVTLTANRIDLQTGSTVNAGPGD